jgi:hypothetical protein
MSAYTMKADADFNEFEAYYKPKAYKEAERRFYETGKTQIVYNDGEFAFEVSEIKRVDSFGNVQYSF